MAFTINKFGLLLLMFASQALAAPVGLNTRDQNPMFQAYYLPSISFGLSHQRISKYSARQRNTHN
jgi:hypothetical protein